MSRQIEVYLLPEDVESLFEELRSKLDFTLIASMSPTVSPVQLPSPICDGSLLLRGTAVRVDCYLAPTQAEITTRFITVSQQWSVEIESEVVEFSGCDFDGRTLVRGRFYYRSDILQGAKVVSKRKEFTAWADNLFRVVKRSLNRSSTLNGYIGTRAEKWAQQGGTLAAFVNPQGGQIIAAARDAEL